MGQVGSAATRRDAGRGPDAAASGALPGRARGGRRRRANSLQGVHGPGLDVVGGGEAGTHRGESDAGDQPAEAATPASRAAAGDDAAYVGLRLQEALAAVWSDVIGGKL